MLRAPARHRRRVDVVPGLHPARGAAARVAGDAVSALAFLEVQRQGDVGLRLDAEGHGVRVGDGAGGDGDGAGAVVEGQPEEGSGDGGGAGFVAGGEGEGGGGDGEGGGAEGVGELDTEALGADWGVLLVWALWFWEIEGRERVS